MTAPQLDPQQPQGLSPAEEAVIAALAVYFGSSAAIGATMLPAALVARLAALGISPKAVRAAGRITMAPPLTGRRRYGSPTSRTSTVRAVATDEPLMRARYLVAAARRLTQALLDRAPFDAALRQERRYLDQHRTAGRNRARAAAELDRVATEAGPWLRWHTVIDSRTDAECLALDGTVFTLDNLPGGLIPGAVHARCRCYATSMFDHGSPPRIIAA